MNNLYTFNRKRACALSLRLKKVCLELLSYVKSDSYVINIPLFLSLYRKNIGPPGLGSRGRDSSSHSVNKIYRLKSISSSHYSSPTVTLHYCHIKYPFHPLNNNSLILIQSTNGTRKRECHLQSKNNEWGAPLLKIASVCFCKAGEFKMVLFMYVMMRWPWFS